MPEAHATTGPALNASEEMKTRSPFSFLLFGASGHLAQLKIYPALYILALKKRLPKEYAIIGFARSAMTNDEFRALVKKSIETDLGEVNEKALQELLDRTHYHQGQYDEQASFDALSQRLGELEKGWGSERVRLAYLSIPPTVFTSVLSNLCKSGIHGKTAFRCIVEKPVGHDLQSFEVVRSTLVSCFKEEEIYLLDHYLGKEAVRNVYYLRYANPVLERLLKNTIIHHVEITADESDGLEGRAGYFDSTGTLRDMFQSHLVEMCALLTMRIHEMGSLQEQRQHALEQLYLPPATNLNEIVIQGQYTDGTIGTKPVPGYLQEPDIHVGSRTNTFVALKLSSRISKWQGVPFYMRSGKRLQKKETRISIQFQVPHSVGEGSSPNRLDIILQGEAGMRLHLQTKLGGMTPAFRPLVMEDPLVCVGDCLPEHAVLLLEAIHGTKDWFLSFEEIRTAWRLIDPLQVHLDKPTTPLALYPAGSSRPKQADEWIALDDLQWFS
jgi:glucose-6-phosphate 1-dehydrogenase